MYKKNECARVLDQRRAALRTMIAVVVIVVVVAVYYIILYYKYFKRMKKVPWKAKLMKMKLMTTFGPPKNSMK